MTPDELRAWRKAERTRLIDARMAMPLDEHAAASAAISANLDARFPATGFRSLGCYWPFRREFNCIPFMTAVVEGGGQAALPVVVAKNQPLEFRPWTPNARMELGVWDIPHPADGPAVAPNALLVALVGFDEAGYRLGYGSGYYDRTVAAMAVKPLMIGVGFELSRVPTIHPQPYDEPMDYIVTEAGTFHMARAKA